MRVVKILAGDLVKEEEEGKQVNFTHNRALSVMAMNGCRLATLLKTTCPELKIILYTGATYVARHDLPSIDVMVHKSEGVEELLAAIEAFLPSWQQNTNSGVRSSAAFT
jgi:hypothetical protein